VPTNLRPQKEVYKLDWMCTSIPGHINDVYYRGNAFILFYRLGVFLTLIVRLSDSTVHVSHLSPARFRIHGAITKN
jgi:hypothetical protein